MQKPIIFFNYISQIKVTQHTYDVGTLCTVNTERGLIVVSIIRNYTPKKHQDSINDGSRK